jgi:hypothetical protein
MNHQTQQDAEPKTAPDYDEYGDVPDSGNTSTTDEREDLDESPLSPPAPVRD